MGPWGDHCPPPMAAEFPDHRRRLGVMNLMLQPARLRIPDAANPSRPSRLKNASSDQRHGHHPGRFLGMFMNVLIARLAGEGHEPHAEHVKRRHPGRDQRQQEQQEMLVVHEAETQGSGRASRPCCTSR